MRLLILLLPALLAFNGCGGNVKKVACGERDWRKVGYDTAMDGRSVRTFDKLAGACEVAPPEATKAAYIDGYTAGIIEYCTFENGYKLGSVYGTSDDICPAELREQFAKGYRQGHLEHAEALRNMRRASETSEQGNSVGADTDTKTPGHQGW